MNLTPNTDIEESQKPEKPSLGIGTIPWHIELRIVTLNLTPNPDYYNPVKLRYILIVALRRVLYKLRLFPYIFVFFLYVTTCLLPVFLELPATYSPGLHSCFTLPFSLIHTCIQLQNTNLLYLSLAPDLSVWPRPETGTRHYIYSQRRIRERKTDLD